MATIRLAVNGRSYTVEADPQTSLLNVLREQLDLTGSKYGCGEGLCGSCTVLVEGKALRSCITSVGSIGQKQITTIEGIASGERLHPVQEAFLAEGAMQCGYCTSGMIMSAVALLAKNAQPSEADIVDFMDGNVCRCGTYPRIVSAIEKAAKVMKSSGPALQGNEPNARLEPRTERDASRGSPGSFAAQRTLAQDDNEAMTGSAAGKGAGR
ncbi:MAG: (2Fe-2S)-binding protein [Candidatus Sulfotelmatobacter sp.]